MSHSYYHNIVATPRGPGNQPDNRKFVVSMRSILYALAFAFIFAITCADLGFISQQIHKYGKYTENYASLEYKNSLGLGLCAVIVSLLICIFHFWLSVGVVAFFSLVLAVFFGTVAGIIRRDTPFRGHSCHKLSQSDYPERWQPYWQECSRIVAIQGLSWALFFLYTMMLFGTIMYMFNFVRRATPGGFYGSPTRSLA